LIPERGTDLSAPERLERFWGLPSLLYDGYRGLFPRRIKRQGREADLSPPSDEVNNDGPMSTPLYIFMAWYLIN
jgi:hypothetical protein